jgi:hypothetical protein
MVKKAKLVVIWNNSAAKYFKTAYQRIKEDSPANAEKVRDGITPPQRHPLGDADLRSRTTLPLIRTSSKK